MSLTARLPFLRPVVHGAFRLQKRLRQLSRPVMHAARVARHVMAYRAPDELTSCPVCGAAAPLPLLPVPIEGHGRTYGFASGCLRCGVVFANPLPSAAQVAEVYSPEGKWGRHRQDEQEKQVSRGRIEQLFHPVADHLNVLAPPAGAQVLDFGCGLGGMLDGLAALGWQTYGIEPAMKGAFARHRELADIPASGSFDLAILHHVLEHITDPLTLLKQMAGAVREGGVLLIKVPNLDDVARHGDLKYCIRSGVHVLAYTSDCLSWLLAESGFQVVSDQAWMSKDLQRHRVVLGRRVRGPLVHPPSPLGSARKALKAYADLNGRRTPLRMLPARTQAAMLDLQRREWRI
ncbi:MAG: class I SAM-dependent methyltransferase [Vicinamibacterales bacterium]